MEFLETPVFTEEVRGLLTGEEYRALQSALVLRPAQGSIIPGSGGLRRIRWKAKGKGKRAGVRVIYYWIVEESKIYMLMLYGKSTRTDLMPAQSKILAKLVKQELV